MGCKGSVNTINQARNEIILFILFGFEKLLLPLYAEALKEWQTGILVLSVAFGAEAYCTLGMAIWRNELNCRPMCFYYILFTE